MADSDSNDTGSQSDSTSDPSSEEAWVRPSWVQTGPSYNSKPPESETRRRR